jgi:hypothetical protein
MKDTNMPDSVDLQVNNVASANLEGIGISTSVVPSDKAKGAINTNVLIASVYIQDVLNYLM